MRAYGWNSACRWEFRIDGAQCSPNVVGDVYVTDGFNVHRPRQVMGYCSGITAGIHTFQVRKPFLCAALAMQADYCLRRSWLPTFPASVVTATLVGRPGLLAGTWRCAVARSLSALCH
jgi:hypothetical protein